MNPDDIDQKMARPDYSPPAPAPSPLKPLGSLLTGIEQAALAQAKRHGLLREDGTVKCMWRDCDRTASLPRLDCVPCRRRRVP